MDLYAYADTLYKAYMHVMDGLGFGFHGTFGQVPDWVEWPTTDAGGLGGERMWESCGLPS